MYSISNASSSLTSVENIRDSDLPSSKSTRKHTLRNVQSQHVLSRRQPQPSNLARDEPLRNFQRFHPPGSEAAKTLRDLSEEMQVMMTNLEIQIDEGDSRRRKLHLRNINLTRLLQHKVNVITNITQQKDLLEKRTENLQAAVLTLQQENALLQQNSQLLEQQKIALEQEMLTLQESFQTLLSKNKGTETENLQLQSQVNLLNAEKSNYQVSQLTPPPQWSLTHSFVCGRS